MVTPRAYTLVSYQDQQVLVILSRPTAALFTVARATGPERGLGKSANSRRGAYQLYTP